MNFTYIPNYDNVQATFEFIVEQIRESKHRVIEFRYPDHLHWMKPFSLFGSIYRFGNYLLNLSILEIFLWLLWMMILKICWICYNLRLRAEKKAS